MGLVTDSQGGEALRTHFDPFGEKTDALGEGTSPLLGAVKLGFTGHRHDDELALIDAKGRVYLFLDLVITWEIFEPAGRPGETATVSAAVDRMLPAVSSATQRAQTAVVLTYLGRLGEALELSERAVKLDPSCGRCFDAHAQVLLQSGLPHRAMEAIETAIRFLPDGEPPASMKSLRQRIQAELDRAPPGDGGTTGAAKDREPRP